MLRILDPPMTPDRSGQPLGMRLQATDEVPDLHRLPSRALHHREDTTDTLEVTPGVTIPQVLGDRRRGIDPLLQPSAIRLLRDVALSAWQGRLVLEHLGEVAGEILMQMGLIVFDRQDVVG